MNIDRNNSQLLIGAISWVIGSSSLYWLEQSAWFLIVPLLSLILIENGSVVRHRYKNQFVHMIRFVGIFLVAGAITRSSGGLIALVEYFLKIFSTTEVYIYSNVALLAHVYLRVTEVKLAAEP